MVDEYMVYGTPLREALRGHAQRATAGWLAGGATADRAARAHRERSESSIAHASRCIARASPPAKQCAHAISRIVHTF
eukprot:7214015-Alexandrium_andersonii.AAC.1